jgi:hypothetical protein
MNEPLDSDRIAQIRVRLQSRDTGELLEIWQDHDENRWTPEAFEAIRQILRERLGEEPGRVPVEYFCSDCGAQVSLTDEVCPACGANVEEFEETTIEPEQLPKEVGRVLTHLELAFFAEAGSLPEEYADYLTVSEKEELVIPARESKVGDLKIRFLNDEIIVTLGRHTQNRFYDVREAVEFIQDILEDELVFNFVEDEVEIYRKRDLTETEKKDWNNYVWSGPLRDRLTGIDWYRP